MKHFLPFVLALFLAPAPSAAVSGAKPRDDGPGLANCALDAQRAVARRHGLSTADDGSLATRVYADPKTAVEADNAFDACVRRQTR